MDQGRIDRIVAAQANLPSYLRRSREVIEADEQAQELQRASFTRAKLTDAERAVSRGMMLESIARANLETEGVDEETEQLRLAQALELQGRFAEASKIHPHDEGKARLTKIQEAVDKPDNEFCHCDTNREVKPQYEVKKIFSRKHKRMVSLVGCKCGELNATPTPPEQLQRILRAHEASALAGRPTMHEHDVINGKAG